MRGVHPRRTAARLVLNFRIGIQVRTAVHDLDMFKACREQTSTVVVDLDGTCDATHVGGHALGHGFGKFMFKGDVADDDSPSRLENAGDLAEDGWLVGRKIENAIRDDAVDRCVRKRNLFDGGLIELDVGVSTCLGVRTSALDHGPSHVDPYGTARW